MRFPFRIFLSALLAVPSLFLSGCTELTMLRERVVLQDQEISKLREENAKFQQAYYRINSDRTSEVGGLRDQTDTLRQQLEDAKKARTEREKQLEEEARKAREAAAQRLELENRLNETGQANQQLNQAVSQAQQSAVQSQQSAAELQKQLDATRAERDQLQASLTRLETEHKTAQADLKTVRGELELAKAARSETESKLVALQKSQNDETQKHQKELKGLTEQVATLKTRSSEGGALKGDEGLQAAAKSIEERVGKSVSTRHDGKGLHIVIPTDAAFEKGSLNLAGAVKPVLSDLAQVLKGDLAGRAIRIEGHTDDQPVENLPFADNWGLGSGRADRVREYLIEEGGIDAANLEVVSRASSEPLASNKTPEGRAKNRRIEIVVGNKTSSRGSE